MAINSQALAVKVVGIVYTDLEILKTVFIPSQPFQRFVKVCNTPSI